MNIYLYSTEQKSQNKRSCINFEYQSRNWLEWLLTKSELLSKRLSHKRSRRADESQETNETSDIVHSFLSNSDPKISGVEHTREI